MPSDHARSPGRMLAPAALLAIAIAVSLIVLGSGSSDDGSGKGTTAGERTTTTKGPRAGARKRAKATYTVKPGDTLGGIGEKTGVEVERLQELNPELDPQALVSGQKIKLRE